jgi:hypothetical protein
VQNALRMVRVLGLVTVQERRQHGPLVLEALAAIGRKGEHPVSAIGDIPQIVEGISQVCHRGGHSAHGVVVVIRRRVAGPACARFPCRGKLSPQEDVVDRLLTGVTLHLDRSVLLDCPDRTIFGKIPRGLTKLIYALHSLAHCIKNLARRPPIRLVIIC